MTKDEALKLALEALKRATNYDPVIARAITAIKEALAQPERDYERGFIDGMQKQMQSSVDKAVNAMTQRTWVGLTDEDEIDWEDGGNLKDLVKAIEAKLKEKNFD